MNSRMMKDYGPNTLSDDEVLSLMECNNLLSSYDLNGEEIPTCVNGEENATSDVSKPCEISELQDIVEVTDEKSIVDELEGKLSVGSVMSSIENAYLLYCQYARAKGFSVKKGDQRYFSRSNELQAKQFDCSCEGVKDEKRSSNRIPDYQKSMTRTNCKARLKITREKGGDWKVSRFVTEHNHEMVAPDQAYLLRSSRNISHAQKNVLEAMVSAGIPVARVVSFMQSEANGPENLGFIPKDAYDHMNSLKKHTKVENGDASALLQFFINKSNKDNFFYWNVQLDDDDRILNFFFRDYSCAIDYENFGDVLSFDTTYRTNKYDLICAPFVGINHHMKNVMFGLAFLSDETQSSFEWLFTTFLDSMRGKQPQIIFTDQCRSMMNAIEIIFPDAHHRLCQWHINQNAPSHFGNLNGNSSFLKLWHKCMNNCESEEEFEATWKFMIEEYHLSEHRWLNGMYKLRRKWASAFSNKKFSAGLLATSRSEGTNKVLKMVGNKKISLYEFVLNYEKVQNNWRANERIDDTKCRHSKPSPCVKGNPILDQVADVYTYKAFKLFEYEFMNSLNTLFVDQPRSVNDDQLEFKVKSHGESARLRQVMFHKYSYEVNCSCHLFETLGILCKHILKVYTVMNVTILPQIYILRRWSKNAKNRDVDEDQKVNGDGNENVSEMVFVNHIMRSTYDLAQLSRPHAQARRLLVEIVDNACKEISTLLQNISVEDSCETLVGENIDQNKEMLIRDPVSTKSRGISSGHITRHWDDKRKHGKGKGKNGSSNAKRQKKKAQISQETVNLQGGNIMPPTQNYVFAPPLCPVSSQQYQFQPSQYSSHFGGQQQHSHYQNLEEGRRSNVNLNLGGQMNLFGYQFESTNSAERHFDNN